MLLKRLFNVAVALLAFIATCALLHSVVPAPPVENVSPKLRFFAEHKNEFDTLLIGTSHIQHQISPALFDRLTAEAGRPTHTFNFGVDGMHPAESFFVIEQILALDPRSLKTVVFELENVQLEWSKEARGTRRLAYWHNWKQTALTVRRAINPSGHAPWYAKLFRLIIRCRDIALHVSLFARQTANVGRVADLIDTRNAATTGEWNAQLGAARDGYQAPNPPMAADRVIAYQQKLQRETQSARRRFIDPYAEKAYREYAAKFGALGARSVFVVTPVVTQSPLAFRPSPPPPGPVFSFNSAKRYPQLYDPAVRADEAHLSAVGADELTRLVASQFLQTIR